MNYFKPLFLLFFLAITASLTVAQKTVSQGNIYCSFGSEPVKTFCESALGEVTSYKSDSNVNDTIIGTVYELTFYKESKSVKKEKGVDFFDYILASEEMTALKQNGKILDKKDTVVLGQPAKISRVYFANFGGVEGNSMNLYFKDGADVVKMSSFVPINAKENASGAFFHSVKIRQ